MSQVITTAAQQIAGCIFDDATGTLAERIQACIDHENLGTDGDLTSADRDALRVLLAASTGEAVLYDSDTTDMIAMASDEQAVESAMAGPEGHIEIDGRRCYVGV